MYRLVDYSGHDELLVLSGLLLALVFGGFGFEKVGLSSELGALALAVAFSFLISAPLNRFAHPLYERFSRRLISLERKGYHPDEQPLLL